METTTIITQLEAIRKQSPLVHNITNFVVMNNTANALLAIGASPVMAHALEEVKDMVGIASALVLNMGTLNATWTTSMLTAGEEAHRLNKPTIFDPVGVGATPYRTATAKHIIENCHPSIIRGNASEINALVEVDTTTKGVDSTMNTTNALVAAQKLQKQTGAVIVVSGEIDYIVGADAIVSLHNGSSLMPRVTGMGCTATALLGAFAGVQADAFTAAVAGMAILGVAGEIATEKANGPGSLQIHLLDTLYTLTPKDITEKLKLKHENI